MESRKLAIWDDKTYCIEYSILGEPIPTIECDELFWGMTPSIVRLAYKVKDTFYVPLDDAKQIVYMVTLDLLRQWEPDRSAWKTYWIKYAYRRVVNYLIVKKNGYRVKEYANSDILDMILTGGISDDY